MMAVINVGRGIGLAVSGFLAKSASYPITFIVLGTLMFLVLPFTPVLFKKGPLDRFDLNRGTIKGRITCPDRITRSKSARVHISLDRTGNLHRIQRNA